MSIFYAIRLLNISFLASTKLAKEMRFHEMTTIIIILVTQTSPFHWFFTIDHTWFPIALLALLTDALVFPCVYSAFHNTVIVENFMG